MKHVHNHFRPKLFCTPRTVYGADYYVVGKKKSKGFNNILGIIDLATGHLVLRVMKQCTAAITTDTLFYKIMSKKGVPLLFHTDAAKEFISTAMDSLSKTLDTGSKMDATVPPAWYTSNCTTRGTNIHPQLDKTDRRHQHQSRGGQSDSPR